MYDIVILGGAGIDTNIYLYNNDIDFNVEMNFSKNIDYIGGAGGYCAKGASMLGYKTAYIGFVGNDFLGEYIKKDFMKNNIDITGLDIDPEGTQRSINFMYKDGRRKNFFDAKGAMDLKPDILKCQNILKNSKIAHFNISNYTRYLLPVAKELNVKISSDIQDIVNLSDEYRKDFIEYSDVLFFSSTNFSDISIPMNYFMKNNKIIISGMGSKGCALGYNNEIRYFNKVDLPLPVIDTNGAGDSLAIGFLTSYFIENYSLEQSILRAQICARYCCSVKANSDELITKDALDEYYKTFIKKSCL